MGIFLNSGVGIGLDVSAGDGVGLNNTVIVNSINDLPTAVADVVTTDDNTTYIWAPGVAMGTTEIVVGANNAFIGFNTFQDPITHTGTGIFITIPLGVVFTTSDMQYSCPDATLFSIISSAVSPANGILVDRIQVIDCETFVSNSNGFYVLSVIGIFNCDNGIINTGTVVDGVCSINKINFFGSTGTLIDLGSTVFGEYDQTDVIFTTTGTAMSGLVDSGNIPSNVVAPIKSCNFVGATTPLNNISPSDSRWNFQENSGVVDSTFIANANLTTPETVTITDQSVFVPVGSTNWVSSVLERFTSTTAGVITYIGERDINILILASATIEKVGGGSNRICMRVSIDTGAGFVTQVVTESCSVSGSPSTVVSQGTFSISSGDEIRIEVSNEDGTSDVIVDLCNVSIINGF